MLYISLAVALVFITTVLLVLGAGNWAVDRLAQKKSVYETVVGEELHRLFLDTSPREFIFIHLLCIMVGLGGGYYFGGIIGVLIGGIAGVYGPRIWLQRQWEQRIENVNKQVEEAVVYMANSFKANPSLPEAIEDVTRQMGPPISEELSVMMREYQLGTPLDQALVNLTDRMPARNLELAVSAIRVGRSVGGNIPEILDDIAGTVRESYRLKRTIDTKTAQGRMQAWVMGAMPPTVCGVFYLMDPGLILPLFQTLPGYAILTVAVILNMVGVYFILKVMEIRV